MQHPAEQLPPEERPAARPRAAFPVYSLPRVTSRMFRVSCFALCLLSVTLSMLLTACGTPEQRYKTLSFFFDGVPDPNKKKTIQQDQTPGATVVTAAVVSRHKPYVEAKCNSCHRSAAGTILEFDEAYKTCVGCHAKVLDAHPKMHGPVARAACQWCHTGHDSTYPALFKDNPVTICTQCHDPQLLGNNPPQHMDGRTSCLQCHFGHGGAERNFLKEGAVAKWPATQAATQSSTTLPAAPATQPLNLKGRP